MAGLRDTPHASPSPPHRCLSTCGKGRAVKHITNCQRQALGITIQRGPHSHGTEWGGAGGFFETEINGQCLFFLMLKYKGKPFQILSSKDLEIGDLS